MVATDIVDLVELLLISCRRIGKTIFDMLAIEILLVVVIFNCFWLDSGGRGRGCSRLNYNLNWFYDCHKTMAIILIILPWEKEEEKKGLLLLQIFVLIFG